MKLIIKKKIVTYQRQITSIDALIKIIKFELSDVSKL